MTQLSKESLKPPVLQALQALGGSGTVAQVAKAIWEQHEADLRASGELFYTWQYDIRWAAQPLQGERKLSKKGPNRTWILKAPS
jgi:hypothetical protein